jgi:fructoselysine-6-P-deglycase FrlB-like protein
MVARCRRETGTLAVTFSRDGEPPESLQAADGRQAIQLAVALLLDHRKLRAGDRLTVEATD